jgi:hypothetical protein
VKLLDVRIDDVAIPLPIRGPLVMGCPVTGCDHKVIGRYDCGLGEARLTVALCAHIVHSHYQWAINRGEA